MNNRKISLIAAVIFAAATTACSNTPVSETPAPAVTSATAAETSAETSAAETTAETAAETSESVTEAETTAAEAEKQGKPVYSLKPSDEKKLTADDGQTLLFNAKLQKITIDNESEYPQLAQAVSGYNTIRSDAYEYSCNDLSESVNSHYDSSPESFTGDYSMHYYCNVENMVSRCDDKVFSFINNEEGFGGGVHGWYVSSGVNYDSQTGAELTVSDICTDIPKLVDILAEKLESEYSDAVEPSFTDSENYRAVLTNTYGEDLQGYDTTWDDGTVFHMQAMNFVFVPDGVMFFSNSYDLTSYAGGTQQLTVLFSEAEEIFNEKYVSYGEDFDIKDHLYNTMYFDFDGDGKGERLTAACVYDDDWNITGYKLTIGDKEYPIEKKSDSNFSDLMSEVIRRDGKYTYRLCENDTVLYELDI